MRCYECFDKIKSLMFSCEIEIRFKFNLEFLNLFVILCINCDLRGVIFIVLI